MKPQLLCTFTTPVELQDTVDIITNNYEIIFNKVFILSLSDNANLIITYNINQGNVRQILPNTISIHRKKETNTFYTINALNKLIQSLNNGLMDSSYKVNWEDYRNSILLTDENGIRVHQTKIYKILEF